MADFDEVPIPSFDSIRPDGTKTFKSETWQERFERFIESLYEIDKKSDNNENQDKWSKIHGYWRKTTKIFLRALDPTAIHAMTATEFGLRTTDLLHFLTLFRYCFGVSRNIYPAVEIFSRRNNSRTKHSNNIGKNYGILGKIVISRTYHLLNCW